MYTLYKFHFLNGISEINQLFDDILFIWPAPVYFFKPNEIQISMKSFLKAKVKCNIECKKQVSIS